jgi:hypothetical protein
MVELLISVDGLPPKKSEAKSLWAADHPHANAVRKLLVGVHDKWAGNAPLEAPVGLDLILWAPDNADLGDATNYLGGIGDVLQARRPTNIDLGHLGGLAQVAIVKDDRQVRRISYELIVSSPSRYRVRVWELH